MQLMVGKFIVKLKFWEERSIARGEHQKVDRPNSTILWRSIAGKASGDLAFY